MCSSGDSVPQPETERAGSLRGPRGLACQATGHCGCHRPGLQSRGTLSKLREVEEVTLPPWPQFPHLYVVL